MVGTSTRASPVEVVAFVTRAAIRGYVVVGQVGVAGTAAGPVGLG